MNSQTSFVSRESEKKKKKIISNKDKSVRKKKLLLSRPGTKKVLSLRQKNANHSFSKNRINSLLKDKRKKLERTPSNRSKYKNISLRSIKKNE